MCEGKNPCRSQVLLIHLFQERGGELFPCEGDQYFTHTENCNTWDKYNCPSKCDLGYSCMEFAACEDISTEEDPVVHCVCQLGKIFNEDGTICVDPPPPTPTERYKVRISP